MSSSPLETFPSADGQQQALRTTCAFLRGAVISSLEVLEVVAEPGRHTLQRAEGEHLVFAPEALRRVNHGCEPNVFFDVDRLQLVALRDLAPHEELVYFYPSTEWHMAEPFECHCASAHCLRHVQGAEALASDVLRRYRLSAFIARRVAERGVTPTRHSVQVS